MMTQDERVNLIIERAAKYIGLTREEFTKKHKKWEKCKFFFERSMVAYYLFNTTTMTTTGISKLLGYACHATGKIQIDKMKDELSDTPFGLAKTKRCYKDLISYIEEGQ